MNEDLKIPNHVGIIMDGNGRWATKRGLPRSAGHKAGVETVKKLCLHMADVGVKYASLYAFSTENFKRSVEEVNYLMDLFMIAFNRELKALLDKIDKKVIINKILAVGIQRPEEAFNFLKTLDFADMVSVGIASLKEAEETFGTLSKI